MTNRPTDLPDFSNPPLAEVVLGVQFNSLEKFTAAYVGRVWQLFKDKYPLTEEHPPVIPMFETFGQALPLSSGLMSGLAFAASGLLGMPRSFLLNDDRTMVLQIQRDRFLHNWRKVADADEYPRFEQILPEFEGELRRFSDFIQENNLGAVEPNQCEVSYINQIPIATGQSPYSEMSAVFGSLLSLPDAEEIGQPDDANLLLRYILKGEDQRPIGRLIVSAEPARLLTGQTIVQLSLTVRGAPEPADIAGTIAFLQAGRRHIVRTFADITSPLYHTRWGRKQ